MRPLSVKRSIRISEHGCRSSARCCGVEPRAKHRERIPERLRLAARDARHFTADCGVASRSTTLDEQGRVCSSVSTRTKGSPSGSGARRGRDRSTTVTDSGGSGVVARTRRGIGSCGRRRPRGGRGRIDEAPMSRVVVGLEQARRAPRPLLLAESLGIDREAERFRDATGTRRPGKTAESVKRGPTATPATAGPSDVSRTPFACDHVEDRVSATDVPGSGSASCARTSTPRGRRPHEAVRSCTARGCGGQHHQRCQRPRERPLTEVEMIAVRRRTALFSVLEVRPPRVVYSMNQGSCREPPLRLGPLVAPRSRSTCSSSPWKCVSIRCLRVLDRTLMDDFAREQEGPRGVVVARPVCEHGQSVDGPARPAAAPIASVAAATARTRAQKISQSSALPVRLGSRSLTSRKRCGVDGCVCRD